MKIATTLFSSKKFCGLLATLLALFATRKLGFSEAEALTLSNQIVGIASAYMIGQGIADHGKGKAEAEKPATA